MKQDEITKANFWSLVISIISRMCHSQLLSSGNIFYSLGLVQTIIQSLMTLAFDAWLQNCYIDAIFYTSSSTISDLTYKLFPQRWAQILFDVMIIILPYGTMTSQILLVSQTIQRFMVQYGGILEANWKYLIRGLLGLCVFFPLCLLKTPKQLAAISPFSIVAALVYFLTVLVYAFRSVSTQSICPDIVTAPIWMRPDQSPATQFLTFMRLFPTTLFALNITVSVPIVFRDVVGSPYVKRFVTKILLLIGTSFVYIIFTAGGLAISVTFGPKTLSSNIITFQQNCGKDVWMDVVSVVYALVLIVAYPLWCQPNRYASMQLFKQPTTNYKLFVWLGVFVVVLTTVLSMFLEDITTIFGLFASFCGFFIYFLVPILCYVKLPELKEKYFEKVELELKEKDMKELQIKRVQSVEAVGPLPPTPVCVKNLGKQQRRIQNFSFVNPREVQVAIVEERSKGYEYIAEHQQQNRKKFTYISKERLKAQDFSNSNIKTRWFVGSILMGLSFIVCMISFVMNIIQFTKK